MDPFLKKLSTGLNGFSHSTKVLVAVSGGCDSMSLLHGLLMLGFRKLIVCHLNHGLRGRSSRADEKFVAQQATKNNLQFEFQRVDTKAFAAEHKTSLETAGRELRYAFFAEVAKRTRCSVVLLGHHADDQLETCWINFLRGTGIAGLAGMRRESLYKIKRRSLRLIRPLLKVYRSEIVQFIDYHKIPFREDATNIDTSFTRNRIRHKLLPFVDQEFGTSHRDAVLRCAQILAEEEDWMRKAAEEFACEHQLAYKALLTLPLPLQRRILRRWLVQEGVPEVGFAEVERVRSLIDPANEAPPAKVNLPADLHARRRAGILFLQKSPHPRSKY